MQSVDRLYLLWTWSHSGSVSETAKRLHITQPAASHQLKLLDQEWGGDVFSRKGKQLLLTEKGKRLLESAHEIHKVMSALKQDLKLSTSKIGANLRIGVSPMIDRVFSIEMLKGLIDGFSLTDRPSLSLSRVESSSVDEKVRNNELHYCILEHEDTSSDLVLLSKVKSPVVLVCAKWMIKSREYMRKKTMKDILSSLFESQIGLVLPERSIRLRRDIDNYYDSFQGRYKISVEADIVASVVRAVVQGLGAAFLPYHFVKREIESGGLVQLGGSESLWDYEFFFYTKAELAETEYSQKFKKVFSDFNLFNT